MKYYFDMTNGAETIRDEEGVEAADLDEAFREARRAVRDCIDCGDHQLGTGQWVMTIREETGPMLASLMFNCDQSLTDQLGKGRDRETGHGIVSSSLEVKIA